jgi:hypothetical protein
MNVVIASWTCVYRKAFTCIIERDEAKYEITTFSIEGINPM